MAHPTMQPLLSVVTKNKHLIRPVSVSVCVMNTTKCV